MAQQAGLAQGETESAIGKLLPALTRGIGQNISGTNDSSGLLAALTGGNQDRFLDQPDQIAEAESEGNDLLGSIFGNQEVNQNITAHAAQETGLDAGALGKLLPMLASATVGSIRKQSQQDAGGLGSLLSGLQAGENSGEQMSGLTAFLDADGDGSVMDDVLNMAKKLF